MASETVPRDVVPPAETEQRRIQESLSFAASSPTDASLQQARTPSGDGKEAPADQTERSPEVAQDDPGINVSELPPHDPTFKEQVYGYARLIRGKVLGQSSVEEQGEQVLRGERGIRLRRGSQSSK